MGVKYGRGFLRSQNVVFAEMDWDEYDFTDVIYIDLLGSFYGFLLNLEERKQATTLKFINWFRHRNVVVVVDGAPSRQKSQTAASRSKTKSKELEKFVKGSIQIADLKEKGKRVSKAKWTNWEKLKRRTFVLKGSSEFIYFLEQVAAAGIQIVHAAGEADVWISKQGGHVMSGDCDLLFHGRNTKWLIPNPKGSDLQITIVTLYNVLDSLSLSGNQLRALAIVSGNDYAANVPGHAIKKNYKLIKKVSTQDDSTIVCVSKYCKEMQIECFDFQQAIEIFAHGIESIIPTNTKTSNVETRSQLIALVTAARIWPTPNNASTSLENLDINTNWVPNKFRPIGLKSGDGVGTRYGYKILTEEKMAPKIRPKPVAREFKEENSNEKPKPKKVILVSNIRNQKHQRLQR